MRADIAKRKQLREDLVEDVLFLLQRDATVSFEDALETVKRPQGKFNRKLLALKESDWLAVRRLAAKQMREATGHDVHTVNLTAVQYRNDYDSITLIGNRGIAELSIDDGVAVADFAKECHGDRELMFDLAGDSAKRVKREYTKLIAKLKAKHVRVTDVSFIEFDSSNWTHADALYNITVTGPLFELEKVLVNYLNH